MKQVWAIARLTFQEGVRMRIVLVFLVVLAILVLRMPFTLRGDDTLAGRLQNFLSYALGAVGLLLSMTTVFFACATLAQEFRTRSLQLVLVKPVARFQVLLGKWLGVNLLNLAVLAPSALVIYGFAAYIRDLPEQFVRDRLNIRDVLWTARVASRPTPPDFKKAAEEIVDQKIKTGALPESDRTIAERQRQDELKNAWMVVPPGQARKYLFENLTPPEREDTVIQVRFKVRGIPVPPEEVVIIDWAFANPKTEELLSDFKRTADRIMDTHQFLVNAGRVIDEGKTMLLVANPASIEAPILLSFQGDDALQILYRVDSFEMNYFKTVALIFMRLAFLAAIGVFFGVFVSFPVACMATFTVMLIGVMIPWWTAAMEMALDLPVSLSALGSAGKGIMTAFAIFLNVGFPNFIAYDGAADLIDGVYIAPRKVLVALAHTILYGGLLLLLPGWFIFARRQVAQAETG